MIFTAEEIRENKKYKVWIVIEEYNTGRIMRISRFFQQHLG